MIGDRFVRHRCQRLIPRLWRILREIDNLRPPGVTLLGNLIEKLLITGNYHEVTVPYFALSCLMVGGKIQH